ncbi:hypothetical protein [Shewanella fodinae]|uniref:hypothetical protein n=1 Tax=Shewanella fodinae TaxID=552357 RepID=UPI0016774CFD|nr:hypothetical protein [Shewanella fodinae]MCL2905175.1 hypothetical protein [Shewanella fodinae]GGY88002.1 hypothetical protein GCM10007169_01490 [Shewanella fodinae]
MTDTKTMVTALNVIADELQAMEGTVQAQCVRDAAVKLADMQKTIEQLIAGNVPDGWKLVPI